MEILKEGNPYKRQNLTNTVECYECDCVFVCDINETHICEHDKYNHYIWCPNCGHEQFVCLELD